MTASTDEHAILFRQILDNPDDDHVRLVYADWLDEFADATEACPECDGNWLSIVGRAQTYDKNRSEWVDCPRCSGSGRVPARPDARDRAELIRVQVELARHKNGVCPDWCVHHPDNCPVARLEDRESALLSAHEDWRPACPVCLNDEAQSRVHCTCAGGRVGTLARGFLESVEVPTLGAVLERVQTITGVTWLPTDWSLTLLRDYPTVRRVRVGDREPYTFTEDTGSSSFDGRQWSSWLPIGARGQTTDASQVPLPIVELMLSAGAVRSRGGAARFPIPEAAVDALALAVCRVLHKLSKPGGRS